MSELREALRALASCLEVKRGESSMGNASVRYTSCPVCGPMNLYEHVEDVPSNHKPGCALVAAKALLARPEPVAVSKERLLATLDRLINEGDEESVEPAAAEKAREPKIVNDMSRFIIVELPGPATHEDRKQIAERIALALPSPPAAKAEAENARELREVREALSQLLPAAREILWCALAWNDHNFDREDLRKKAIEAAKALGFDKPGLGNNIEAANRWMERLHKALDVPFPPAATGEASTPMPDEPDPEETSDDPPRAMDFIPPHLAGGCA